MSRRFCANLFLRPPPLRSDGNPSEEIGWPGAGWRRLCGIGKPVLAGRSLSALLGGTRKEIPCGVSIGIQESVEKLLEKIRAEVDAGYQRVKIKIKPGWDLAVLERVREQFPRLRLMADANSAYTLLDRAHLKLFDRFCLMMIEQPLAHDDLLDHARLQKELETPLCLDESIRTLRQAEQAIELEACRIVNIKLGRVGGFREALRIHNCCRDANVPVWCGGMLESGIGRAHNIALSTLPNFTLPGMSPRANATGNRT